MLEGGVPRAPREGPLRLFSPSLFSCHRPDPGTHMKHTHARGQSETYRAVVRTHVRYVYIYKYAHRDRPSFRATATIVIVSQIRELDLAKIETR